MSYVKVLDFCESVTGYAVFDAATTNLAATTSSWFGTNAIEFDKAAGTSVTCGAGKTLTGSQVIKVGHFVNPHDYIGWELYVTATTNIAHAFVRIGRNATNYLEFRYADSSIGTNVWTRCNSRLGDAYITGTGCDWDKITYIAIGVVFDSTANTLADMWVDHVYLTSATLA